MKTKIMFLITVGSHIPKKLHDGQHVFPIGGYPEYHNLEFEIDKPENAMDDAFKILAEKIGHTNYHIWYWWWIK